MLYVLTLERWKKEEIDKKVTAKHMIESVLRTSEKEWPSRIVNHQFSSIVY